MFFLVMLFSFKKGDVLIFFVFIMLVICWIVVIIWFCFYFLSCEKCLIKCFWSGWGVLIIVVLFCFVKNMFILCLFWVFLMCVVRFCVFNLLRILVMVVGFKLIEFVILCIIMLGCFWIFCIIRSCGLVKFICLFSCLFCRFMVWIMCCNVINSFFFFCIFNLIKR